MKVTIITGTPATGKTTLAKQLVKEFGYKRIDLNKVIKETRLRESFDTKKHCWVVDIKKLTTAVKKQLAKEKKKVVIDSHLSHYLPKKMVDLCIVTTCSLKILQKRLKKRKYSAAKIRENLDAEIFEVCKVEAEEGGHKVIVLEMKKKFGKKKLKEIIPTPN